MRTSVSEPTSGMTVPSQTNSHIRTDEVLAAVLPPSEADLNELRVVASNLDRRLAAKAMDIDDLACEFERVRNPLRYVNRTRTSTIG